jgi:hypothetical protein
MGNFAQSEYVLQAALSIIPDIPNKMKKLRANVSWVLGNLYGEALRVGCEAILQGGSFDMAVVQKKIILFPTLSLKWPEFKNF